MDLPPNPYSKPLSVLVDCAIYVAVASLLAHWLWHAWLLAWPLSATAHSLLIVLLSLPAWLLRKSYLAHVMQGPGGLLLGTLPLDRPNPRSSRPLVHHTDADVTRSPQPASPGASLRRYLRERNPDQVKAFLQQSLPSGWPITRTLADTAAELAHLAAAVRNAQAAGLATGMVDLFHRQADHAARALAQSVNRVAATAAQDLRSERVDHLLAREEEDLAGLAAAITLARETLTELILDDRGELGDARLELQALGKGIQEVIDQQPRSRA